MKIVILVFLFIGWSFASFSFANDLVFSAAIAKNHREIIQQDLLVLKHYPFKSAPEVDTLPVFGLEKFSNDLAYTWLRQRMNYIFHSVPIHEIDLVVIKKNIEILGVPQYGTYKAPEPDIMSNLGAAIYQYAINNNYQLGLFLKDAQTGEQKQVIIDGPQKGLIQLGSQFFSQRYLIVKNDPKALVNSIHRLMTYFHEARHGDGNIKGKSLTFPHVQCPIGHDYEGREVCDQFHNGSYMTGALALDELVKNCSDKCSFSEKMVLKMIQVDQMNRVLHLNPITNPKELERIELRKKYNYLLRQFHIYQGVNRNQEEVIKQRMDEVEQEMNAINQSGIEFLERRTNPKRFADPSPQTSGQGEH